ncbi:MAG: phage shock protein A [Desulfobacteraceae bacterium IS3]|nr:MAG: phage shock protein A [Desulfobacteraceae bacterium IS3]
MSIFSRIFKIGQAEAHSAVDKFEDPVKMTEQGVRDLKQDLQQALNSLAQVKGIAITTGKNAENKKKLAADYERKAMLLLQKIQSGGLAAAEGESLATEALVKKEEHAQEALRLSKEAGHHGEMANQLEAKVNKIKSAVSSYENDLITLKARSRTAESAQKINRQISQIDTSGTVAMLERMKAKVEEEESLAQAYGEIADADKSVDDQIQSALAGEARADAAASLAEMKKKMGMS